MYRVFAWMDDLFSYIFYFSYRWHLDHGVAGIMAAKVLADNGIRDFLILEATDRIGGRVMKHEFAGHTVEGGAGWVAGVGGNSMNPIWHLANQHGLHTCYSDYSNARFNIYDHRY